MALVADGTLVGGLLSVSGGGAGDWVAVPPTPTVTTTTGYDLALGDSPLGASGETLAKLKSFDFSPGDRYEGMKVHAQIAKAFEKIVTPLLAADRHRRS